MIRLILLLLGARTLRDRWWMFAVASAASVPLALVFIANVFDTAGSVVSDLVAIAIGMEGIVRLLRLAAIGFPNATVPVLKSLGFVFLALLSFDVSADDNILVTITVGTILALDGIFRMAAAVVIRSMRWPQSVGVAVMELCVALLVWLPWPVPHRHTEPA